MLLLRRNVCFARMRLIATHVARSVVYDSLVMVTHGRCAESAEPIEISSVGWRHSFGPSNNVGLLDGVQIAPQEGVIFRGGGIFHPIAECRDYALFGCAAMRWLCALPTSLLDAARGDKTRRCGHLPYYLRHSLILLMVTVCRLTTTSSTSECVTSSYTRASSSCFYQLFRLLSLAISILTIFINCSKFPHANVCVYWA